MATLVRNVASSKIGSAICRMLKLDPMLVSQVSLYCQAGECLRVVVDMLPSEETLGDLIREFEGVLFTEALDGPQ